MKFLHPEFLYYMLPPLVILFGFLLTQKESVATFFSQDVMSRLRVRANILTLKARNALFMLIAVLMVAALAEPVIPEGIVEVKAKSADIMVGLDISDSMLAEDLYPNRLKLAKEKILELLRQAPNERIGVIAFAKNSYLVSPLSFDHDAVSFLVRKLSTDSITEKGTDILSLLEVVEKSMQKESKKYLLLLSDGGDKEDFSKEIAFAKEKNIAVFVLAIGTKSGAPIKRSDGEFVKYNGEIIVSKLNSSIASLATKTGGVYIESTNAKDDIRLMLEEIEAHSEKKELKSQEIARYIPLFYYPLGVALLLLLIATSSMSRRRSVQLPSAFMLFWLLSFGSDVDAAIFDFVELKKAKEAYERGEYERSAQIYSKYAQESQNPEAYYNAANALYKQGAYAEARELYQQAAFSDSKYRAKNLANLGNSYAKEPTEENLQSALKAYEESLALMDDKEVAENLEAVKKALQEMQQEQESQEQENGENQEQEDSEKQEEGEGNQQDKQENSEQKESSDQDEESQENRENEQQKSDENQELDEQNAKQEQNDNNQSQSEQPQEPQEQESPSDENSTDSQMQAVDRSEEMSESEEQKWLQMLGEGSGTYLYRLNEQSADKENLDEKPW